MRRYFALILFILVTVSACTGPSEAALDTLDTFRWENRLIVVFAQAAEVAALEAQFSAENDAIVERDILWFIIADDTVTTNYTGPLTAALAHNLRTQFARQTNAQDVVLIGKDGGIKNRLSTLDSTAIYGQIDQMPMRRAEMEARGQ